MRQVISHTHFYGGEPCSSRTTPLLLTRAACGFPSPADDYIEQQIDLNDYCIARPAATLFVIATGESMVGAGIYPGDLLVVDMAEKAPNGKIVVALVDGECTVKRLRLHRERAWLLSENPHYPPIEVRQEQDFSVLGVVMNVIHKVR